MKVNETFLSIFTLPCNALDLLKTLWSYLTHYKNESFASSSGPLFMVLAFYCVTVVSCDDEQIPRR